MTPKRSHNAPLPPTADADIDVALSAYLETDPEEPFNLGVYGAKGVKRASATIGKGILSLRPLIMPLLCAQPHGRYSQKQLEARLVHMVRSMKSRRLNTSSYPDEVFAYSVTKRLTVVFCHWRKLLNAKRYTECCSKMTPDEKAQLDHMIEIVYKGQPPTDDTPIKKRKLERHVSLDSDGYPAMLANVSSDSASSLNEDHDSWADAVKLLDDLDVEMEGGAGAEGSTPTDTGINTKKDTKQEQYLKDKCMNVAKTPLPARRGR